MVASAALSADAWPASRTMAAGMGGAAGCSSSAVRRATTALRALCYKGGTPQVSNITSFQSPVVPHERVLRHVGSCNSKMETKRTVITICMVCGGLEDIRKQRGGGRIPSQGKDHREVLASYGHVRDLLPKEGSVKPEADFEMVWQMSSKGETRLSAIRSALADAQRLILATDPDREGEAIAWHVLDLLQADRSLPSNIAVERATFTEVTPKAIKDAIASPRKLDLALVEAYLCRRSLDYLMGFHISPVLWRKLPGCKSAGRVQSVALRLLCEREAEREAFKEQEYWTVQAAFSSPDGQQFTAQLTQYGGKALSKFSLSDEASAQQAASAARGSKFYVNSVKRKQVRRNAPAPFTTSTLQQQASLQLGFTAERTMRVAQKLYEGIKLGTGTEQGLISYMRTDGTFLSAEATGRIREYVYSKFGDEYLPESPAVYKNKSVNAQEAHEAIRPTDVFRSPADVQPYLEPDQLRLYALIWKRTVACQMSSAISNQVAIDIASEAAPSEQLKFRATGSTIMFDGFLAVRRPSIASQEEEQDDDSESGLEESRTMPVLEEGDLLSRANEVTPVQHFTEPPPRYTEGTLVKQLEEMGIGRPSTYAPIMQVLLDRSYIRKEKRTLIPESRGRILSAFLTRYFPQVVDFSFTAELENSLDSVSCGEKLRQDILRRFWSTLQQAIAGTEGLKIREVLDVLNDEMATQLFPDAESRQCPRCSTGQLSIKIGASNCFIACTQYPDCKYATSFEQHLSDEVALSSEGLALGNDPKTGAEVVLKAGPFGHYVQATMPDADPQAKPIQISLPKGCSPTDITLDSALALLSTKRTLGNHPEDNEPVSISTGKFGPYVRWNKLNASIPKAMSPAELTLQDALDLLAKKAEKQAASGKEPKERSPAKARRASKVAVSVDTESTQETVTAKTQTNNEEKAATVTKPKRSSKKTAVDAADKPAKLSGFQKPVRISPELAEFLQISEVSRPEAVKRIWAYIKSNGLQDPSDGRIILCDNRLVGLLGVEKTSAFQLAKHLSAHFVKSGS
eukprot:jgi/Chlat1/1120/Chrsp111S01602